MFPTIIKLDGAKLARERLIGIQQITQSLIKKPSLVIISVGDDPASAIYVKKKLDLALQAGFDVLHKKCDTAITEDHLHALLDQYSNNMTIDAILIQLPLPAHLSAQKAVMHIHPDKDVDVLHPLNIGRLVLGTPLLLPCTPKGILSLMNHYNLPIKGQQVVILGRSLIVGTPLSILMTQRGATVTLCHRDTPNPIQWIAAADIVVTATGKEDVFPAHYLKKNSVFIDVGIIRTDQGIRGDLMFHELPLHIKAYTPVPFGIGPMTVISLMENVLTLYQHRNTI